MFRPSDDQPEGEGDGDTHHHSNNNDGHHAINNNNINTITSTDSHPENRTPSGKLRNGTNHDTPEVEHVATSMLPTMQWSPPGSAYEPSPQPQTFNNANSNQHVIGGESNSYDGFQDNPPIVPVTAQAVHAPPSPAIYPNGMAPVVISYPHPDPIKPTTNDGVTISCTCCKVNVEGASKRTKIFIALGLLLSVAAILLLVVIDNPLNLVKNKNNSPQLNCEDSCYEGSNGYRCSCLCYGDADIDDFPECISQDIEEYDQPIICEPECFPLATYREPCNCLCYQDEIDDLDPECNDDEDFWKDLRDDYFLRCEPLCYEEGRDAVCSCLCYTPFELSMVGKFCRPYDGPLPIYYTADDDFVQHFHCDPVCWKGPNPSDECDCICFDEDNKGNCS